MKRAALSLAVVVAASLHGQSATEKTEIEVLPVQGNVYMLAGAGSNVTVQVGRTGVLMVDTQPGGMSDKILAAVRKLSDKPIRYLINTSADADHTGGNENIARTGAIPEDIPLVNTPGATAMESVQILAHQNVLNRLSLPGGGKAPAPSPARAPSEIS